MIYLKRFRLFRGGFHAVTYCIFAPVLDSLLGVWWLVSGIVMGDVQCI